MPDRITREKHLDTAEYLRDEQSHAILAQNTTLWRGHKFNDENPDQARGLFPEYFKALR